MFLTKHLHSGTINYACMLGIRTSLLIHFFVQIRGSLLVSLSMVLSFFLCSLWCKKTTSLRPGVRHLNIVGIRMTHSCVLLYPIQTYPSSSFRFVISLFFSSISHLFILKSTILNCAGLVRSAGLRQIQRNLGALGSLLKVMTCSFPCPRRGSGLPLGSLRSAPGI